MKREIILSALEKLGVFSANRRDQKGRWSAGDLATDLADLLPDTYENYLELKECYEIVLKTARRCARDLKHACDDLKEDSVIPASDYRERYAYYNLVLGGTSEYRQKLHLEIKNLEYELSRANRTIEELLAKIPKDPNQKEIGFETTQQEGD